MTDLRPWAWALCGVAWAAVGCADSDATEPDLPPGWQHAELVEEFTQTPCEGSAYEGDPAEVSAQPAQRGVDVDYRRAHFRCEQDVEAYLRSEHGVLDVLVQPVDMDPSVVAACDCLYDIWMHLPSATGEQRVTVYRRWDNLNDDNDPIEEGRAQVTVP